MPDLVGDSLHSGQFWDRNPVDATLSSGILANIAPHGGTTRFTYTVPSKRLAIVNLISIKAVRRLAATTSGQIEVFMQNESSVSYTTCYIITNVIGDKDYTVVSPLQAKVAGGKIVAVDSDGSAGGSVDFIESATITEFDA
jgi:hypothetical protein